MLLKTTSRLRGSTPAASGSPVMVYVFPELVMPVFVFVFVFVFVCVFVCV